MENKKIRFISLDFAINNVGVCVADAFIDSNNRIVVEPIQMFQAHTKQNYSTAGYANYNLYASSKVTFKFIRDVIRRFEPSFIVGELPHGRRPFSDYKAVFDALKNDSETMSENDIIEKYFNTENKRLETKDGALTKLIRDTDRTSMCLGSVIGQFALIDQICPVLTVNYRDAKEGAGLNKRYATKEEMIFRTKELFPNLGYIFNKDSFGNNKDLNISENEHACDAVMLAYCLESVQDRNRNARHFIERGLKEENANKNRGYNINYVDLDSVLNKYS